MTILPSDVAKCLYVDYPILQWDSDFNCMYDDVAFQIVQHSQKGTCAFRYLLTGFDVTQHWGLCLNDNIGLYQSQGEWWLYELIDNLQRFAVSFERFLNKINYCLDYAKETYDKSKIPQARNHQRAPDTG